VRHSDPGGRFNVYWEHKDIFKGIDGELRAPVGQHVQWIEFDQENSDSDVIYDVADNVTGRQWKEPIRIPSYAAIVFQGQSFSNDRGFYNTDILRVSVAMNLMEEVFPELVWEPDRHIKDRVLYRGKIFIPTRTYLRGLLRDVHTIFTIDANQANAEEYVNDPQLLAWTTRDVAPPQPYDPNRHRERSTL
jgi:hypothetical protein